MIELKVKLNGGILPRRANPSDAGIDLATPKDVDIDVGAIRKVGLGFSLEIPRGYCAVIKDRSSLGANGLHVLAGVIDSGYRGEWAVVLVNLGPLPISLNAGHRIAQALIVPVPEVAIQEVDELSSSDRGEGGFGSTGS